MEQWKDIPGYEGRYQASDAGRIRSLARQESFPAYTTTSGIFRCASVRRFKGVVLKPATTASGHQQVMLGRGQGNNKGVHVLVCLAFHGTPPTPHHEVLHGNHTPADNRAVNLRWGTRSENMKMDYAVGTRKTHPNFNRWGYRYDHTFF